jgi:hypothetical protein
MLLMMTKLAEGFLKIVEAVIAIPPRVARSLSIIRKNAKA